jgi:hypothetical protein
MDLHPNRREFAQEAVNQFLGLSEEKQRKTVFH